LRSCDAISRGKAQNQINRDSFFQTIEFDALFSTPHTQQTHTSTCPRNQPEAHTQKEKNEKKTVFFFFFFFFSFFSFRFFRWWFPDVPHAARRQKREEKREMAEAILNFDAPLNVQLFSQVADAATSPGERHHR
jgi:hypothetical protein